MSDEELHERLLRLSAESFVFERHRFSSGVGDTPRYWPTFNAWGLGPRMQPHLKFTPNLLVLAPRVWPFGDTLQLASLAFCHISASNAPSSRLGANGPSPVICFCVMPIEYIVALLIAERDKLNQAIEALGGTVKKRRGRPPKNPFAANALATPAPQAATRKRRGMSAAARKAAAARMKAYWAKKRNKK